MSGELKQIKYTAPAPVKRVRKTKKQSLGGGLVPAPAAVAAQVQGPAPVLSTIRIGGAKKQTLKVAVPYTESAKTPSPAQTVEQPVIKVVEKPVVKKVAATAPKVVVNQNKRKNLTLKRKFTNKRITIHVENSKKLKKLRENAVKNLNKLSASEILTTLKERGLVRPQASPPDSLNRAMMLDIMMFPKPL